jgi:hypothetical protein
LTDLAALGDLSRLSQGELPEDGSIQSLGLPLSGSSVSVFSLFRMPLGAFQPHDQLYVFEEDRHLSGLLRVERDSHRDEWTIVELDAIGAADAGDIRFRLVQSLMREGAKRGAVRFHVACIDSLGNVELFMQSGFARYGEEIILVRPPGRPMPDPWTEEAAARAGIRSSTPLDALALSRLYAAATPGPIQRLEAYRLADWERQGSAWRIPRSSLAPILRFADVEGFVQESADRGPDDTMLDAFLQVGVAKEDQPHYLKVVARPGVDVGPIVEFGLGVICARTTADDRRIRGVIAPVRTYESPIDRRLEEAGFGAVATVTLLMKETLVRVAEPALVPAIR